MDIISKSIKLIFTYQKNNEDIIREVIPICYGTDIYNVGKIRAMDGNIPKLWLVEKMKDVKIGNKHSIEINPVNDTNICNG